MTQPRPDEFKPPPECPVFEPSWEEFADPFAFINKIRPIAEKTGICKVRPPPDWQPPFACDVDRLHFTPRIQRLNELEAQTRVKLNFLDQIAKFWELQGCSLKIPHVERKILDLYLLNKLVAEEGGFDVVCRDRHWTQIALRMGFAPGKAVGSHLRAHYERILYPYNLFQSGANLLAPEFASKLMPYIPDPQLYQCVQKPLAPPDLSEMENKLHSTPQRMGGVSPDSCPPARRAKRMDQGNPTPTADELPIKALKPAEPRKEFCQSACVKTEPGEACENRPNLRRRVGSLVAKPEPEREAPILVKPEPLEPKLITDSSLEKSKGRYRKPPPILSVVDLYVCLVCGSGNDEDKLLLCDGCDDSYHIFCLIPPLTDVPRGDWRCPKCLAQECGKPLEAFGFDQSRRDYSLRAFGEMADNFKSDYFNMPVHMVPTELVEKEFWRLVSTIEEDVTVEYGADIASKDFGSGFPICNGRFKVAPADEKYLSCGWNLNNMAMMSPSVLTHVTADICGMTLPWLYVGMCFSSFCWHIEDHWSYSINYLHWGEPKTWYGAPGYAAEQLEEVMRKLAPELFESQPDLLHQLVTIMNPNTLMSHGVPIYRTNQCAGEFVITFPRAYHSGFNQGFNFAEAVNFCTVDWMPLGRQCVDHYRMLNRYCVFSHDEMICNMAAKAVELDVVLASAVHKDMALMVRDEKELRECARKMGVVQWEVFQYEQLADDERQCVKCRTTCFLSALVCPCRPGVQVCLHHTGDLCSCPLSNYTLRYRFALDELYPMLTAVKKRSEVYDEWAHLVSDVLEAKLDKKRPLSVFRTLVEKSDSQRFPENDLLRDLRMVTLDAEKCSSVAQQLLNGKRQTRFRSGGGKAQNQLTVEEVRSFVRQLYNLPCSLPQAPLLKELLNRIEDFQQHSEKVLNDPLTADCVCELEGLLAASTQLDVALPELPALRSRLEQARWLREVQQAHTHTPAGTQTRVRGLTLDGMRRLIDQGVGLGPNAALEKAMARLQELLTVSESWEEKARSLLRDRPVHMVEELSECVREVENIPAHLPNCLQLQDTLRKAKDWLKEAQAIQQGGRVAVLDSLSDLIARGRSLPVQLEPLARLEGLLAEVMTWKESAAKTFLLHNSPLSLLEVLCPRCEVGVASPKRRAKKEKKKAGLDCLSDIEKMLLESKDSASAILALESVRVREVECLSALRASNESKLIPAGDCDDLRVCVCQCAPAGAMLQCELCRDAFHSACVSPADPEGVWVGGAPWLCPQCLRSQRPPLDRVLPLLAALQRTRVRLPEGDALRFLIEKTVAWQRRARQFSASSSSDPALLIPVADKALKRHTSDWNRTNSAQTPFYTEQRCIPLQGLTRELEELLVEGLLLQVSLPEFQQLYSILLNGPASPHNNSHGNMSPREPSPDDSLKQFHSQDRNPRNEECVGVCERTPKRRVLPVERMRAEALCQLLTPRHKRARLTHTRRRQRQATSASASPSARSDLSSDPCDLSDPGQSDHSEDEAILCPAEHCLQPEGEEVFWVQCDGSCNQWFHMMCVGVTAELAEKEDYVCVSCVARQ